MGTLGAQRQLQGAKRVLQGGLYEAKEGFNYPELANRGSWLVPIEDKEDHSLTFRAIRGQIGAIYGRNGGQWGPNGFLGMGHSVL